jgi:cytochrome c556
MTAGVQILMSPLVQFRMSFDNVQATLAAFAALGKEGCGGCHETFRKKQD